MTIIKFAPNQKLPTGYRIVRVEDHYYWEYGEVDSVAFCNRWDCWHSAHAHAILKARGRGRDD